MDQVVIFLDEAGGIARWNDAAQCQFLYSSEEIVGKHVSYLFNDEDCVARLPDRELRDAALSGVSRDESWLVRRDGTQFRASGLTIAFTDNGDTYGYAKVIFELTGVHEAEARIREARDRMRLALSAARMGIWRWDVKDDLFTLDENVSIMFGLPPDQPPMVFLEFLRSVHRGDRTIVAAALERSKYGRQVDAEFRVVLPGGVERWMVAKGDAFGQLGAPPRYVTGACVDVTDRKLAEIELQQMKEILEQRVAERTAQLEAAVVALQQEAARRRKLQSARKRLLRRMVAMQEEERRHIARELHDSFGQFVTAMNLGVKTIKEHLPPSGPARERADKLSRLTAEMGQEVHRIALELRPRSLDDISLQDAIQQHLEMWSSHAKIAAEFHNQGLDGLALPMEIASTVYRVVQEALVNVARHAHAERVSVVIERHGDQLSTIVEDDGRGFETDGVGVLGGTKRLGLLGMRERASLVGGELKIESFPDGGTTVFLRIPLANKRAKKTS